MSRCLKILVLLCLLSARAQGQVVQTTPLEWLALSEGQDAIHTQLSDEIAGQTEIATQQNAMAAEFTKMKEWEGKYQSYLQTANGYASQLKAATTLYEDGVRILVTLGKLRKAAAQNTQGALATLAMNDLYAETATELVSVYTLLRNAVATGGQGNMLTGAERSQTLWSLEDKLNAFSKKLNRLYLCVRYYTLTDVWNNLTTGMIDRNNGPIANEAYRRWKRAGRVVR